MCEYFICFRGFNFFHPAAQLSSCSNSLTFHTFAEAQEMPLPVRMREVRGSNLGRETSYLTDAFHGIHNLLRGLEECHVKLDHDRYPP